MGIPLRESPQLFGLKTPNVTISVKKKTSNHPSVKAENKDYTLKKTFSILNLFIVRFWVKFG